MLYLNMSYTDKAGREKGKRGVEYNGVRLWVALDQRGALDLMVLMIRWAQRATSLLSSLDTAVLISSVTNGCVKTGYIRALKESPRSPSKPTAALSTASVRLGSLVER